MEQQACLLGLSFERVEAIDGRMIENPVKNPVVTDSAYACFLSHRKIWAEIAGGDDAYVLVLEDDIHFSPQPGSFLRDCSWIPEGVDIVHLEEHGPKCLVYGRPLSRVHGRSLYRLAGECTGAGAYIISKRCAAHLGRIFTAIDRHFDTVLFDKDYAGSLNILKLSPAICTQDQCLDRIGLGSDNIGGGPVEPELQKTWKYKLARETGRVRRQVESVLALNLGLDWPVEKRIAFK